MLTKIVLFHFRIARSFKLFFAPISLLNSGKFFSRSQNILNHCADITRRNLIHGFLQVVIIFRDYTGGARPFLGCYIHWGNLKSFTICLCRQIIKDFNYAWFLLYGPEAFFFVKLRQTRIILRNSLMERRIQIIPMRIHEAINIHCPSQPIQLTYSSNFYNML